MKKYKDTTIRKILIIGIALFFVGIGREFIEAEQNRKTAIQIQDSSSTETDLSFTAYYLPKHLIFQTVSFPQNTIDEFLDSDANEISIDERKVSRKFAKIIQDTYQLNRFNNTYFAVTSFLNISSVISTTILIIIFGAIYIVRSEIKEKRNANQSSEPT